MSAYVEKNRIEAEERGRQHFKDHVLRVETEDKNGGRYDFRSTKDFQYQFRVIAAPRLVMMYGDAGELVLIPSDGDALGWLMSVMRDDSNRYDVDYILSKVPNDLRKGNEEFQMDLVTQHIEYHRSELKRQEDEIRGVVARSSTTPLTHLEMLGESTAIESIDTSSYDFRLVKAWDEDFVGIDSAGVVKHYPPHWTHRDEFYEWLRDNDVYDDEPPNVDGLTWNVLHQLSGLYHFCKAMRAHRGAIEGATK